MWGGPPGEPLGGLYSLKEGEWEVAKSLEALGGVRRPRVVGSCTGGQDGIQELGRGH